MLPPASNRSEQCARIVTKILLAACINGTTSDWAAATSLSVKGKNLTIRENRDSHVIPLPTRIAADTVDLVALQHSNGFQYLVFFATVSSRRGNPWARCGAGEETSLVWLQLTNWQITDEKNWLVNSCWFGIDLMSEPYWKDEIYTITFSKDYKTDYTLRYNRNKPEEGLQFSAKRFN